MTPAGTIVNGRDVGRYRDRRGSEHLVGIRQVQDAWEVVDRAATRVTVVDRLEGPEESEATAEAVAADWIAQHKGALRPG